MNNAMYPPQAYNPAPSNGASKPPIPEAARNIPRFFSRSSLIVYLNNKAYSPTIFDALEIPIIIEDTIAIQTNDVDELTELAKPRTIKATPNITAEVNTVNSIPTLTAYAVTNGTVRILVKAGVHRMKPVMAPDNSNSIATNGKNTGIETMPIPIQRTLKQKIFTTPSAIFFDSPYKLFYIFLLL